MRNPFSPFSFPCIKCGSKRILHCIWPWREYYQCLDCKQQMIWKGGEDDQEENQAGH